MAVAPMQSAVGLCVQDSLQANTTLTDIVQFQVYSAFYGGCKRHTDRRTQLVSDDDVRRSLAGVGVSRDDVDLDVELLAGHTSSAALLRPLAGRERPTNAVALGGSWSRWSSSARTR